MSPLGHAMTMANQSLMLAEALDGSEMDDLTREHVKGVKALCDMLLEGRCNGTMLEIAAQAYFEAHNES